MFAVAAAVITIGLLLDVAGVMMMGWWVVQSREQIMDEGFLRLAADSEEENLALPHVQKRLKQWRVAVWGLRIAVAGFVLQIVGTWLQFA